MSDKSKLISPCTYCSLASSSSSSSTSTSTLTLTSNVNLSLSSCINTSNNNLSLFSSTKSIEELENYYGDENEIWVPKNGDPNINAISFDNETYCLNLLIEMFDYFLLLDHFSIPKDTFKEFLNSVQSCYNNCMPFHSFKHAWAVTQMCFMFISKSDLAEKLSHLEKFVILISCICHDLDHPGVSNEYLVKVKSPIAEEYDGISPLENHHYACAQNILSSSKLLDSLEISLKNEILEKVKVLILSTDLLEHHSILSRFQNVMNTFDWNDEDQRLLLLILLMKAADLSNEVRPFEVSESWYDLLNKEKCMVENNGEPSTLLDSSNRATTQVSFIDTYLLPLFRILNSVIPRMGSFLECIKSNRLRWEKMASLPSSTAEE